MKRLLFLLCLSAPVLGIGSAGAQEATITGITPESFSGIRLGNNGERYYLVFMDAAAQDSASMVLKVFDRTMQPQAEVRVPVAKGTLVAASAFTGQFYVVQLVNPGNKTRSIITADEAGRIINRKDETDIKASLLTPAAFPAFYPVGMNEILVVRTSRDGKSATELSSIDAGTNSRWSKTLDGTEFTEIKNEMDRVYALRKEKVDGKDIYSIQSFSGIAGDVFFTTELRKGDNLGIPGFLNVQQGFVSTGGVFRREAGAGKPEGLFFAKFAPNGLPEQMHFVPWDIIKTRMKNSMVADLESGKTGLLIKNAVPDATGDGVMLIGESYKRTVGAEANTASFATQDFVLVHMTKEGEVDKVAQVPKQETKLVVKGSMSAKSDLELAQWLDKNNFFAYRAIVPVGEKRVITWLDNRPGKSTVTFATIDSTGTVAKANIISVNIDGTQVAGNGKSKDAEKTDGTPEMLILNSTEKDLQNFAASRLQKNMLLAQEGHVLIYNYTDPEVRFWIIPVEVRQ